MPTTSPLRGMHDQQGSPQLARHTGVGQVFQLLDKRWLECKLAPSQSHLHIALSLNLPVCKVLEQVAGRCRCADHATALTCSSFGAAINTAVPPKTMTYQQTRCTVSGLHPMRGSHQIGHVEESRAAEFARTIAQAGEVEAQCGDAWAASARLMRVAAIEFLLQVKQCANTA